MAAATVLPGTLSRLWNLGTLAAGESRTISVNALVSASTLNGVTVSLPVKFSATGVSEIQN